MTTTLTEISPNEPDVSPDYVDGHPAFSPAAAVAAPEPQPPEYIDMLATPAHLDPVPASGPAPESDPVPEPAAASHRDGECVPNVPDIPPDVVPDAQAVVPAAPGKAEALPDFRPPSSPWLKWHLGATVLIAAALGVLVFSQAISALALAAGLPVWAQYALLIPLGVCCLAVVVVALLLVRAWLRLRAVRQVDLAALEELRARAQSRQDGVERFQDARAQLERYLGAYPLDVDGAARLAVAGLQPHEVEALARARDYLRDRSTDSRSWLADYRELFQKTQDAAAAKRVNSWSLKAAGCVIASPLPLLDSALVLGIAFKMLKDLCFIYNVRAGRSGSLVLLNRAIVAAFIAGVAEDAMDVAGGVAAEELSVMVGEGALASVGAKAAGVVAPKLGEGAVNAFFIRRLGKAAVRMLQPLRPQ